MLNRFDWLKYLYTMQIKRFKLVVLMLNRVNRLKHVYTRHINRFNRFNKC